MRTQPVTTRARTARRAGVAATAALVISLVPATPALAATYSETTGIAANTWTNYMNAGGTQGPTIPRYTTVQISCALEGFRVRDGNTWWYKIASSPWDNNFYASADAFYNNGQTSGSLAGTPFVDPAVPICGAEPAPPPAQGPPPSVTLERGPEAPHGYRYAITLRNFPPNQDVDVNCFDTVDPQGFYPFTMRTDGSGYAFTQGQCYSADGPDHWVIANGVESNHVTWGGSPGGGSDSSGSTGGGSTPTTQPPPVETCEVVEGVQAPASDVSWWLLGRFEGGYSGPVVIPWEYFSGNPQFVEKAKSIPVGEAVVGWRAVFPSDMYFALGRFTITRTSEHCYSIFDIYDFDAPELPFWLQQVFRSAIPFEVRSSGKL